MHNSVSAYPRSHLSRLTPNSRRINSFWRSACSSRLRYRYRVVPSFLPDAHTARSCSDRIDQWY
ncbi:MAG: hypothetical protein U7123_12305 [Potamolinea sp.]